MLKDLMRLYRKKKNSESIFFSISSHDWIDIQAFYAPIYGENNHLIVEN